LSIGAVWVTVGFGLLVAPLAIYTLGNWDVVMGRPGGVSVFEPGINNGDFVGTLIGNTLKALGMFVWQGDRIPRHNVPWRPVFDPLLAAAFVAGLIVALRQARERIAAVFILTGVGVMPLPPILAEDAPHFLRAVGALPVAAVFPALGLDWLARIIQNLGGAENTENRLRALSVSVAIVVLASSAGLTIRDYAPYAASAETGHAFEAGAVELAGEINRLSAGGHRVLIDDRYEREWTAIAFLLERPPDVRLSADSELPPQPGAPALLVTWPYADWSTRLGAWSEPVQIEVRAGPLVQGDRDPQPYPMAVLAVIRPVAGATDSAQATFGNGVRLLASTVEDRGDVWVLRTLWRSERPVTDDATVFAQLLNDGALAASADGDAGDGLFPMRLWRAGDVVVDERQLSLPAAPDRSKLAIAFGLYNRQTAERVPIVESSSSVSQDALLLGAPGGPGP
jgi:hypothetical protein